MGKADQAEELNEVEIRSTVEAILVQRGWKLLSADELARRAAALLRAGFAGSAGAAALHIYAEMLYHACCGTEGRERRQLAYVELLRYLYDASFRFAHELSRDEREEVVHQALAELAERLAVQPGTHAPTEVRSPGAFLAVAAQQLRNVVRRWRSIRFVADEDAMQAVEAGAQDDPAARAVARELARRVQQCFAQAQQRYPRAKIQLMVVWMRVIDDLDYEIIAAKLLMTVANVRVLYTRGMDRLRNDPDWIALGTDIGLTTVPASAHNIEHTV
jgi:DNA-directed RNA polymerase specialized sigma24 family protein